MAVHLPFFRTFKVRLDDFVSQYLLGDSAPDGSGRRTLQGAPGGWLGRSIFVVAHEPVHAIGEISPDLLHPLPVGLLDDPRTLHLAT